MLGVVLRVTLLFDRKAVPQLDIFVNAVIAHRGIHELILERICAERLGLALGSANAPGLSETDEAWSEKLLPANAPGKCYMPQ